MWISEGTENNPLARTPKEKPYGFFFFLLLLT